MSNAKPFTELLAAIVDNRGRTCPTSEEGIPLIATNCINNVALYPAYDKVRFVSQETFDTWFRGHPEPGDLIFVTKGSPGRVCMAPDPVDFCIAQDMVAVRPDPKKVYPKYLFAALRSHQVQQAIGNMHVGTLIPHFKKGDFDKLDIPLPDSDVQKTIGDMYYSLSAKIELNRRMNETLEAMARAIFKSWFVDFDPVRAKASGEPPKSICRRLGLMPDVLALFPDSFQESALGEIPAGWTWSTIGDEAEIVGGGTPSTKVVEYWNGGTIYWTTPKDLSGNPDRVLTTTERKITEAGLKSITSGLLPIGTVLMSSRAPVGYLAMAKVPTAINQGFIAMKCEKQLSSEYVLQWAHSVMDQIKQRSSGTTFAEISKKNFRSMSILVPPVDLVNQYTAVTSRLYDKITTCVEESRSLIDLRDMLLPKLMSGDISVGELQDD
ncbi:MAG: restriction endonuclease subunit S [Sulfuritalea sp.]|jgi:type I restriction enzyme S subunit|nr:restriction endonuclease subunit S [Sulfuritalea sp.]